MAGADLRQRIDGLTGIGRLKLALYNQALFLFVFAKNTLLLHKRTWECLAGYISHLTAGGMQVEASLKLTFRHPRAFSTDCLYNFPKLPDTPCCGFGI